MKNSESNLEELQKQVKLNPKDKSAWNSLAFLYLENGKMKDSLNCYEEIIKRYPKDGKTYHKKAIIEERLEMSDQALKSIDSAIKFEPENVENYYTKGWLLHRKGMHNDAISLFEQVTEIEPMHFNALDYLYKSLFILNSYREIINHAERILPIYEKRLDDLIDIEEIEAKEKASDEYDDEFSAYRLYKKLADDSFLTSFSEHEMNLGELKPKKLIKDSDILKEKISKIYRYISISAMRIRDFEIAQKSLKRETELNPEDLPIIYNLGLVEEVIGNLDDAKKHLHSILEKDPNFQNAKMKLAGIYSKSDEKEDLKTAVKLYSEIIKDQQDNTHAQYNLAKIQYRLGDFDKAIDSYKRTIELSPGHLDSYEELSKILIRQNKIEEAQKYLKEAESLNPFDYEISNLFGIVFTKLEMFKDAKRMFEKAIQLDPFSPKAYFNYGISNLQNEDFESAVFNLRKCAQIDLENPNVFFYLGIGEAKLENYEAALNALEYANELDPDSEDIKKALEFVSKQSE